MKDSICGKYCLLANWKSSKKIQEEWKWLEDEKTGKKKKKLIRNIQAGVIWKTVGE